MSIRDEIGRVVAKYVGDAISEQATRMLTGDLEAIAQAHAEVATDDAVTEPVQVHLEFTGDPERFLSWLRQHLRTDRA